MKKLQPNIILYIPHPFTAYIMYVPTYMAYIQYSTYTTRLTYITLYIEMGSSQHPEYQMPEKTTYGSLKSCSTF